MGDGGGRAGRAAAEGYVDAAIDDDGTEHGDEDPEVVEPEAVGLVVNIDPALLGRLSAFCMPWEKEQGTNTHAPALT